MTTHNNRDGYWEEALNGQIQVLDYAATNYGSTKSLRAAAYREATARGLTLASVIHDDRHLLVAAFGGRLGGWKMLPSDFRCVSDMFTGDPDRDVTVRLAPALPSVGSRADLSAVSGALPPATDLPPIEPSLSDPLFTNPGSFWVNRTWEPAAVWVNPFKDHPVGPQQCIWTPKNELWDLEDLSWLQDRRAAGTLYPWELRQGFCPPGTALSHTYTWTDPVTGRLHGEPFVWKQEEWLELALERCYCTCDMSRDGSLVDPGSRDHYSDPEGENSCPVWTAPDPEDDLATITAFMDPRGALVPGLMDDAEARVRQYAAMKRQKDQVRGAQ